MSDYTVYDSEAELRDNLSDVQELLDDFRQTQQAIEEQRSVLAEQMQGSIAIMEKRMSEYEQQRDVLDQRQAELIEQRQPFEQARDRLQQQIDAKQDAQQDATLGKASPSPNADKPQSDRQQEAKPQGPVTKDDIEKLKAQLSKPALDLTLDPPGMSQAGKVDRDLKAKLEQKEQRMDTASKNLRDNWNQSKGPKP